MSIQSNPPVSDQPASAIKTAPLEPVASVDDGEYFAQARDYARLMYDVPIVERSYWLLALVAVCFAFLTNIITLSSLWPLNRPIRLLIENNNSGIEYPRVVRLAEDRIDLQSAVARYIMKKYVTFFESYSYSQDDLGPAYRFIYNNSAPEIFQNYRARLDPANAASLISTLGQLGKRSIDNVSMTLEAPSISDGIATIKASGRFTEVTQSNGSITRKSRNVQVEMMMYELAVHKDTNSVYQYDPTSRRQTELTGRIGFRITHYQSQP